MSVTSGRAIALVDCDSFFASCEQLLDPSLAGKPVCVMSNNDGCIVARSKEAKKLGIKMGMPVFKARKLFPHVHYISGRIDLYGEISNRVMTVLKNFSPVVEIYSIDEAFIDLTGLRRLYKKPYIQIAADIRREVKQKVGVPVSVGVSLTKTLAKLSTDRAKKAEGAYLIGFRSITKELKTAELIDIWGMGLNTVALLNKYGVYNAYEFTIQNELWIKKILGKKGVELKHELSGESIYPVLDKIELPKSIQKTSSFATFTADPFYIKNSLNYHTHRACKKLRRLGLKAGIVGIMLRTKDFKVTTACSALIIPTDWEFEVFNTAERLFEEIFTPGIIYRSSGIYMSNLIESQEVQLSLFESPEDREKKENLSRVWDQLEKKYGRNILTAGTNNENKQLLFEKNNLITKEK
jgi:DNA polymerase-4/DNA polymerase V